MQKFQQKNVNILFCAKETSKIGKTELYFIIFYKTIRKSKKSWGKALTKCGNPLYNEYGKWDFERSFFNMGAVLAKILNAGGVGGAIREITDMLVLSAESINIPKQAVLIAGLLLAVWVGILGYKYIKLVAMTVFGIIGYAIGSEFFYMANNLWGWELPAFVAYLFGIVMFVLLGGIAYKKFAYALFFMAGMAGFLTGYFIYPNYFLATAIAILVALLAISFIRYGFIIILSVTSGFILASMISDLVPDVRFLSLTEGYVGIIIAVVASLLFMAIQLQMSRIEIKKLNSLRRVKIRRVFDAW